MRCSTGMWLYSFGRKPISKPLKTPSGPRGFLIRSRQVSGFYARQEIQDQLNLLRLVECPDDALALAGVLSSPFLPGFRCGPFLVGPPRRPYQRIFYGGRKLLTIRRNHPDRGKKPSGPVPTIYTSLKPKCPLTFDPGDPPMGLGGNGILGDGCRLTGRRSVVWPIWKN